MTAGCVSKGHLHLSNLLGKRVKEAAGNGAFAGESILRASVALCAWR